MAWHGMAWHACMHGMAWYAWYGMVWHKGTKDEFKRIWRTHWIPYRNSLAAREAGEAGKQGSSGSSSSSASEAAKVAVRFGHADE